MVCIAAKMGIDYQLSNFQPALDTFIAFLERHSMTWSIAGKLNQALYAS
jgi:hypothetical protein